MYTKKNKVRIKYDRINEVLYVSFGTSRPSYCFEEIDDIFIMKDIETDEYSGIKILDFMERVQDGSLFDLSLPFDLDFKSIFKQTVSKPS